VRVLVACEFSGVVRDAFIRKGHEAVSCDLLPTDSEGPHIVGDALEVIWNYKWDLMIAHPPCTHLAVSGSRWFYKKRTEQEIALQFVRSLMDAPINKICIENPISIISSKIRKPDQIIQPYMFGHLARKSTCLWLVGLPKLVPTTDLKAELKALPKSLQNPLHYLPPSPDRGKKRSVTYNGIALAMASQWSKETI
jgi:hypothetical protein